MDNEQARHNANEHDDDEGGTAWSYIGEIDEEEYVDINGNGENVDDYWAKGWLSGFIDFRRFNVDGYKDRAYEVFPTRYRLKDFKLSKSQRKLLKKTRSLHTIIRPLRITEAKSKLYLTYQEKRHHNTKNKALGKVYDYIKNYPTNLLELCVFNEKKLIACSIFQIGNEAMYSDVAFWDLEERRYGLGILTVLLEMKYGQNLNLKYYYLGHYFRKNPNYHYKTRFAALELYDWDNDHWIDYADEAAESLLRQKLVPEKDDDEF